MKLATFSTHARTRIGVVVDDQIVDLSVVVPELPTEMAAFLGGASRTLDVALYDLRLGPESAAQVRDALRDATLRGVAVRLASDDARTDARTAREQTASRHRGDSRHCCSTIRAITATATAT